MYIKLTQVMPCPNLTKQCIYVRMHVRARGRSRTVLANERKRTRTQINARKRIVAFDAWAISAFKRDCVLRVRSKTFKMYYNVQSLVQNLPATEKELERIKQHQREDEICQQVMIYRVKLQFYVCDFVMRFSQNEVTHIKAPLTAYPSS